MLTEFQKDLKTMTLDEALTIHNLTLKEAFTTLHHQLLYGKQKPKKKKPPKYIQKRKNKYYVRKHVGDKVKTFGTYNTFSDAKKLRDHCMKYGWKQTRVDQYCKELGITRVTHPLNKARYH